MFKWKSVTNQSLSSNVLISGLASLVIVGVMALLAAFTFWFPQSEKTQNYYLSKDLMICVFIYVAIPLIVIKKNHKMRKYLMHHLKNSQIYKVLDEFLEKYRDKAKLKSNKVANISIINKRP